MRRDSASIAVSAPSTVGLSWLQRRLVEQLARLRQGTLTLHIAERTLVLNGQQPGIGAELDIVRPTALLRRLLWRGDLGLAEAYIAGDWHTNDLAKLLELFAVNLDAYARSDRRHPLAQAWVGLQHKLRRNSRRGSRRNIASHYDLGNDFYARWLDDSMTYSAALYDASQSLPAAQRNKYARLLDQLDAVPGQTVLEIGCGWGGFAEYAASRGVRVIGLTLSKRQLEFARARIARVGLNDLVDLRLCDYRDFDDKVDHVVSIEMFEAVGRAYWSTFFAHVERCLRPGGRAALQVITIDEAHFEQYASTPGGFIQTYIFPGGMLPTKSHLSNLSDAAGLRPGQLYAFGADYADTLAEWLRAFDADTSWLAAHGYDERFRRMWRYYLAFCEAGFRACHIDVVQCTLQKE